MANLAQLQSAVDTLAGEVGETVTEINNLKTEILALKDQINDPAVQAQIDSLASRLGEQAAALDAAQTKAPVTPE